MTGIGWHPEDRPGTGPENSQTNHSATNVSFWSINLVCGPLSPTLPTIHEATDGITRFISVTRACRCSSACPKSTPAPCSTGSKARPRTASNLLLLMRPCYRPPDRRSTVIIGSSLYYHSTCPLASHHDPLVSTVAYTLAHLPSTLLWLDLSLLLSLTSQLMAFCCRPSI